MPELVLCLSWHIPPWPGSPVSKALHLPNSITPLFYHTSYWVGFLGIHWSALLLHILPLGDLTQAHNGDPTFEKTSIHSLIYSTNRCCTPFVWWVSFWIKRIKKEDQRITETKVQLQHWEARAGQEVVVQQEGQMEGPDLAMEIRWFPEKMMAEVRSNSYSIPTSPLKSRPEFRLPSRYLHLREYPHQREHYFKLS